MKRIITIAIAAGAVTLSAGAASADSWTRNWTGPNGAHGTRTVNCGYWACSFTAHGTGPNGQNWSRSGGTFYGPYHTRSYRTFTGPNGNTYVSRKVWHHHW